MRTRDAFDQTGNDDDFSCVCVLELHIGTAQCRRVRNGRGSDNEKLVGCGHSRCKPGLHHENSTSGTHSMVSSAVGVDVADVGWRTATERTSHPQQRGWIPLRSHGLKQTKVQKHGKQKAGRKDRRTTGAECAKAGPEQGSDMSAAAPRRAGEPTDAAVLCVCAPDASEHDGERGQRLLCVFCGIRLSTRRAK